MLLNSEEGETFKTEDERDDDWDNVGIKVVVVGDGAVGKSSLIQRYCCGTFRNTYSRTIGADFLERRTTVNGERVRLMVWDTAGQEEFASITRVYYRGAACCVVAFSTTDTESLANVKKWNNKVPKMKNLLLLIVNKLILQECGPIPTVLVQTKIDMIDKENCVNQSDVENVTQELGFKLFKTSSLENQNVEPVFDCLVEKYLDLIARPAPVISLSKEMFGAADKLRRGDTILLSSKKRSTLKYFSRPSCFVL